MSASAMTGHETALHMADLALGLLVRDPTGEERERLAAHLETEAIRWINEERELGIPEERVLDRDQYVQEDAVIFYRDVPGSPVGSVYRLAGGGGAPEGTLLAHGQVLDRETYSELYAAIGDAYWSGGRARRWLHRRFGRGFRVPDMRGTVA